MENFPLDDFSHIFVADKQNLDHALAANKLEQNHLHRCMKLAQMIRWPDGVSTSQPYSGNIDNEFGRLLGVEGVALFDRTLAQIVEDAELASSSELQDPGLFLEHALFVHDLGKYDKRLESFNGTNHEERSAMIVEAERDALQTSLLWAKQSVDMLVALARFHGMLGIVHLGGASMIYLAPMLAWLAPYSERQQRLFLRMLVVLNCCDAGASGNFETQKFYLNHSRLNTYLQVSEALLNAARELSLGTFSDPEAALIEHSVQSSSMIERIQRIVASNNRLSATSEVVGNALEDGIDQGYFDPLGFAMSRIDHGTYVFEPMLVRMNSAATQISQDSLVKVLLLIGMMSQNVRALKVISLRDTFSMKPDLQQHNRARFEALFRAVAWGNRAMIQKALTPK